MSTDSPERLALDRAAMDEVNRARALDYALTYHRDIERSWLSVAKEDRDNPTPDQVLATANTFLGWLES